MILLLATLALAQDAEPEEEPSEPEVIEIPESDDPGEELGSALDDPDPIDFAGDEASIGDLLDIWKDGKREMWGASNFFKPTLSMVIADDKHPTQLGISLGRRWWQLRKGPSISATVQGTADFALGGGKGSYALGLTALAGPWFHVVGLQIGPGIAADRWDFGGPQRTLTTSGGVDAWALLILDIKILHLFGGAAPRWLLSDRPDAGLRPFEGLGDELAVRGGVGATLGAFRLSFDYTRRWNHIGPIDRYGLGVRFRLL